MKRREFLAMALGAVIAVPVLKQTTIADARQKLMAVAIDYINGSNVERERIIENINHIISEADKMKRFRVKRFIEDYRDTLLSYNVIPAA